jgi:hypothetical protein
MPTANRVTAALGSEGSCSLWTEPPVISDERVEMRTATTRGTVIAFAAVTAAMLSMLISVGSASAVTLKGQWAQFNRCPVEDPTMLSASVGENGGNLAVCSVVDSPNGSITIGNLSAKTGRSNTQVGLYGPNPFESISPKGGAIVAAPLRVPGGLVGLVCPKGSDFKGDICTSAASRAPGLNVVTSTLESAGVPYNLNLAAALEPGKPIVTIPVKLHLQNPFLGPNCYIGSNASPILLQPATVVLPALNVVLFDADGTLDENGVMFETEFTGSSQADDTFAAGTATGCGAGGRLNFAINRNVGLPSPAGKNSIALNEVTSDLVGLNAPTPTDGQDLSKYWHAGISK